MSSLLVEDLRPAHLHKAIAARKRCAKIAQLKKAVQIVAQQLPEKTNEGRIRRRERVRKPHNRAAQKAQAPKIDLDSEQAFPSLPARTATVVPQQAAPLLILAPLPQGPLNFAAALAKEALPLPVSLSSEAVCALPCAEKRAALRDFARALVPRVAPTRTAKPVAIRYTVSRKIGAFRRPLGTMFSPVEAPTPKSQPTPAPAPVPMHTNASLSPSWLTMGLSWAPMEASVDKPASPLAIFQALPSVRRHKKSRTVVTKQTASQKKAEKLRRFLKDSIKNAKPVHKANTEKKEKHSKAHTEKREKLSKAHTEKKEKSHRNKQSKRAKKPNHGPAAKSKHHAQRGTSRTGTKKTTALIPEAFLTFLIHRPCPTLSC